MAPPNLTVQLGLAEPVWYTIKHPAEPWYRTECTCGWREIWLADERRCKPCPKGHARAADSGGNSGS